MLMLIQHECHTTEPHKNDCLEGLRSAFWHSSKEDILNKYCITFFLKNYKPVCLGRGAKHNKVPYSMDYLYKILEMQAIVTIQVWV